MNRTHPNFHFYSVAAPSADMPAVPSQVLLGAVGNQFQSACGDRADAPAVAYEPGVRCANPHAAAGNEFAAYRFGSGPSLHQPGSIISSQGRARSRVTGSAAAKSNLRRLCIASETFPNAARSRLKLSQLAQTALDILAVSFSFLFVAVAAVAIFGAPVLLVFFSF